MWNLGFNSRERDVTFPGGHLPLEQYFFPAYSTFSVLFVIPL
jgi:hypothetical protein